MATLYVDYKNGNDTTGDGATGTPFKTITHALTHANNNDTLLLRGNTTDEATFYREYDLAPNKSGLTVRADTGHAPIICASQDHTSWAKTVGQTNVYEATTAIATVKGAANGATILQPVADVATCDSTTNSFTQATTTLYVNIGGTQPDSIEVADSVMGWFFNITSSATLTVDGLIFQWMPTGSIYIGSNGVTFNNCTFRYQMWESVAAHLIIRANADNITISNCSLTENINRATSVLQCLAGCDNMTISGTTIINGTSAIELQGGTNYVIDGCTFRDNATGVYMLGTGMVRFCTFNDTSSTGCASAAATGAWTIHHNVFYHEHLTATSEGIVWSGGAALNAHHNVFYNLGSLTSKGIRVYPLANGCALTAYNNIFHTCINGILDQHNASYDEPTYTLDYNAFYICTNNFNNIAAGAQGSNNVTADPKFTSLTAGSEDFRLLPTSPCIDAGTLVAGINEGFRGGAPDIGAYEYVKPLSRHRRV